MKTTRQQAIKDLEFFFCESEAAMGVKSSHAAFIAVSIYNCVKGVKAHPLSDKEIMIATDCEPKYDSIDILKAAKRNRQIHNNYSKLSSKDKMIFEAYYEERRYDSELVSIFGEGLGLIPLTSVGQEFSKLLLRDSTQRFTIEFKKNIVKIKREVEKMFNEAIDNYLEISKGAK